jgi:hypothetical protein
MVSPQAASGTALGALIDAPPRKGTTMPRYRIHFLDQSDNVIDAVQFEEDHDHAAVEHAHRINVPSIGSGFEVWRDDRLVHKHRN